MKGRISEGTTIATKNLKTALGEAIRIQRSARRLSQLELAEKSGLHRTYISDVERGGRNPTIQCIERIARALGIPISKLFEQAGD